jgi:hypothetical protein
MGPLYAHLSRDPYPSAIMKRDAWSVWSWTERMLVPIAGTGQYGKVPTSLFDGDNLPSTLIDLLAYMGREFADEVAAHVEFVDEWLEQNPDTEEGDVVGGKASKRSLGMVTWTWHGHEITTHAIPYRILHLQRIQKAFDALDSDAQSQTREVLSNAGLEVLVDIKARRRVQRSNNVEAWGEAQEPSLPASR